ncbi:hypothetical protein [Halovenus marina]|jgi:hypothetical protein|uniref:hypothetical protein n=1 Tax=Halovenus marina TaxID=3396621 RepID=UPI003F57CB01
MNPLVGVLQVGPLETPPELLLVLLALVVAIIVARFVLALAKKVIIIGLIIVGTLWVLAELGFQFGVF